jgi:hypothetical protein
LTKIFLGNVFLFSAISPITDDNATFFCLCSFGRLLGSKTKKRSPEAICSITSGLLYLGAMA